MPTQAPTMPLDAAATTRVATHQQATGHAVDIARTPSGSRPGPRWFVIASLPQAERRAYQHLQEQGYQAYLPLCTVRRRDRVIRTLFHRIDVPLFAGYLFTRFDANRDPWRPILSTLGVFALIRRPDGMPNPVAEADFQAVQAVEALKRSITPLNASWAPGMPCSPATGTPFAGHPAVVLSVERNIAKVALLLFGELRTVTIDVASLVPRDA